MRAPRVATVVRSPGRLSDPAHGEVRGRIHIDRSTSIPRFDEASRVDVAAGASRREQPWHLVRTLEGEWMDEPGIDPALLAWALRDLDRLNRWGRTAAGLAVAVRHMGRRAETGRPLTVVDLGCGGGGVTVDLARRLGRGVEGASRWRVIGVDASATCVAAARAEADRRGVSADFLPGRVGEASLDSIVGGPVDIVVSSLFLHHLDDPDLDALLADCAVCARIGVVMDDLRRDRVSMALVRLGTRLLSRCPVVHVDGPRSVRAALTPGELQARARSGGLHAARVRRAEPARMRLSWSRRAGVAEVNE